MPNERRSENKDKNERSYSRRQTPTPGSSFILFLLRCAALWQEFVERWGQSGVAEDMLETSSLLCHKRLGDSLLQPVTSRDHFRPISPLAAHFGQGKLSVTLVDGK